MPFGMRRTAPGDRPSDRATSSLSGALTATGTEFRRTMKFFSAFMRPLDPRSTLPWKVEITGMPHSRPAIDPYRFAPGRWACTS